MPEAKQLSQTPHIRWMLRCDMPEVLSIERDSFDFPWIEEEFLSALRRRNTIGMVAENRDARLGFMLYELHRSHLAVLHLAVRADCRRLGIGSQMVAKLAAKLSTHQRQRLSIVVRESNCVGHLFFKGQGFEAVEVLRGFFEDSGEDGYRMDYAPGNDGATQSPAGC